MWIVVGCIGCLCDLAALVCRSASLRANWNNLTHFSCWCMLKSHR